MFSNLNTALNTLPLALLSMTVVYLSAEYQSDLTFDSPLYEKNLLSKVPNLGDKRKAWHQNLAKDLYISEALNVLDELKLRTAVELVRK